MGVAANIPEIINDFNVYSEGNKLIGVSGSVTLPSFDAIVEEVRGAGILGTYETSIPGFFSSMTQEVPFRVLTDDPFSIMDPNAPVDITFRASEQSTVKSTGSLTWNGMRVVERGRFKSFKPGNLELGKTMDSSITHEILYIMIEIDGKTVLEYDKLNSVFTDNGKDLLEKVKRYN